MKTEKERVYDYVKWFIEENKKQCSKYDVEEHFRPCNNHIPTESVHRYLRYLTNEKRLQHPDIMGIIDKSMYELGQGVIE